MTVRSEILGASIAVVVVEMGAPTFFLLELAFIV